jgi:hypothetical protein
MSADTSDMERLERDLRAVPAKLVPKIKGIVERASLNTKKLMQADLRGSSSFAAVARTVDYEVIVGQFGGDASIEGSIGPNRQRGEEAALAGFAYFGGAKGGGGTVRDPVDALLEEAPNFLEFMGRAADGTL